MHTLAALPRIAVGTGAFRYAPAVMAEEVPGARRILAICDSAVREHEAVTACLNQMVEGGAEVSVRMVSGEPVVGDVDAGVLAAQQMRADVVLAIGGGSAIDLAKLVASVGARLEPAAHYALAKNPMPSGLPVFAVPTTSGTGAEVTRTAVAADTEGRKFWFYGDVLKPRCVFLDPALTIGLPASVTAITGLDALVHAVEAATNVNAFAANTFYALKAARLIKAHLPRVVAAPDDLAAREAMQLAACWAGVAIDNAGCAIAHGAGHALASLGKIPHGQAVTVALLATLPTTIQQCGDPAAEVFDELASMFGVANRAALPDALDGFVRGLGVALSVGGYGIGPGDAGSLAGEMLEPQNSFGFDGAGLSADMATALSVAQRVLAYG